jgi:hypothetical protein
VEILLSCWAADIIHQTGSNVGADLLVCRFLGPLAPGEVCVEHSGTATRLQHQAENKDDDR